MKSKNSDSPSRRAAKTAKSKPPRKTKPRKKSPAAAIAAPAKTAPATLTQAKAASVASATAKVAPAPVARRKVASAKTPRAPAAAPPPAAPVPRHPLKIPPLLLEGDSPAPVMASGPGSRYVLGPTPPAASLPSADALLPESYGTRQLFLAARDPRWLYAHWDFTAEQLREYNALSADGHLLLRVFRNTLAGQPLLQIHLHPESRHWFVPVPFPAAKYLATLGYYDQHKQWVEQARSGATMTPPDSVADDVAIRFATIPIEVPLVQLLASVQAAVRTNPPLAQAVQQLRAEGFFSLPLPEEIPGPWTPAQEKALAAVVSLDPARRIWIGSVEVTELIRRQLEHEVSSIAAAQFGLPPSSPTSAFGGPSSPSAGQARPRGFWFNVNAELILYGATEPDAVVSIGGREIKLRRDGSFSFRFALPDGNYDLPATAQSADGVETRRAELNFSRKSQYHGGVGTHPQDKQLQPPSASAVD